MDDISSELNNKKHLGKKAQSQLPPDFVELVKFLARISAQRDYNRLLQEQKKPKEPS